MSQMPISPDQLAAYFNAATAITAAHYGLPIRRISLTVIDQRRRRPELMPLAEFAASRQKGSKALQPYIDYATVLIAGSVGRLIGLESHLAYDRPCAETARLERAFLTEATLCFEPDTDVAFSIIVGWLKNANGGNAAATFGQLWRRALLLLRRSPHHERLALLVEILKRRRELTGDHITAILAS